MHHLQAVAASSLSLPAESYIYGITAAGPGTFAAISSDDSLRVFDAADLNRGAVVSSHTHDGGVTSLRSYAGESQLLTTGGRDGKVRIWDVRAGRGGPVVEMETGKSMCGSFPWCWF
jgi:WD40 repeat protein